MLRILKNIINTLFSRVFIVGLMLAVQILLFFAAILYASGEMFYVYLLLNLMSFVAVLGVVSNRENPSYKMTWIIAILTFPITGGVFYLMFGNKRISRQLKDQIEQTLEDTRRYMPENNLREQALLPQNPHLAVQSAYITNMSGYPVLECSASEYFPVGELMFQRMLEELEQAEHYIFMEYFIIQPGIMWDTIFDLLKRKIKDGVEVWLMYDDIGSINTLPSRYDRIMRQAGIKLCIFNPFRPRVSVILNNRDHRKIMVIDGHTAFCGGINLADEYINAKERCGHWKDTGILLKGEAVWPFTFMFLQQWHYATGEEVDYQKYRDTGPALPFAGLVQPFGDSPLDNCNVTEIAYMNIISRATDYVYITSPYLIIDNEMEVALCAAAESGVDVRIITPYIYDKWYVHLLTRSHYPKLIESGVKIYEYTPGFMHGKMFVSDDQVCMVGTCNMDFRSFYLHFECSVTSYQHEMIQAVKKDMLDCQKLCHRITIEDTKNLPIGLRILRAFLKVFAPLM